MENVLYVGNLPFDVNASELRARFSDYGEVSDVQIVTDNAPSRSRCFGVVTMKVRAAAAEAIQGLNGSFLSGRSLVVSWLEGRVLSARPQRDPPQADKPHPLPPVVNTRPARVPPVAAKVPERPAFDDDSGSDRRRKGRGVPAHKAPVRMLQQFRERTNMTYELDCSGTPLVVRIFFPGDGPAPQWRVEACTSSTSEVASAAASSRALALESIARSWHDQDLARTPTKVDWIGVAEVMAAVRAI